MLKKSFILLIILSANLFFHSCESVKKSHRTDTPKIDYAEPGESGRFDAVNPGNSILNYKESDPENNVLTTSEPSSFGFLDNNPAVISLEGSISDSEEPRRDWAGLNIAEEETVLTDGGDTNIFSAFNTPGAGKIYIRNGRFVIDNSKNGPITSAPSGMNSVTKGHYDEK